MPKKMMKEIVIALLCCLVIALVYGVILYDYSPSSGVIPQQVEAYVPSQEIQNILDEQKDSQSPIVTFDTNSTGDNKGISQDELKNYEKSKIVDPGKSDPFASYGEDSSARTENGDNVTNTGNGSSSTTNQESTNKNGDSSTGTFFEKPGGK